MGGWISSERDKSSHNRSMEKEDEYSTYSSLSFTYHLAFLVPRPSHPVYRCVMSTLGIVCSQPHYQHIDFGHLKNDYSSSCSMGYSSPHIHQCQKQGTSGVYGRRLHLVKNDTLVRGIQMQLTHIGIKHHSCVTVSCCPVLVVLSHVPWPPSFGEECFIILLVEYLDGK